MPIYTVRAPDGKSYDLRAPDGTSEEQLAQALYEQVPEAFRSTPNAHIRCSGQSGFQVALICMTTRAPSGAVNTLSGATSATAIRLTKPTDPAGTPPAVTSVPIRSLTTAIGA